LAYDPNITQFTYLSQGTGAAIATAEAGSASALIVHAESLENQFVASGYSNEQYGRAIFYGDYVLLGPAADPADIMSGGQPSTNIVDAFQKIAAAGAAGTANFVSRGGTPGTTVEEHDIWSLTHGVTTCTVSTANGGGTSPSTSTGTCPNPINPPSWYHITGLTQGPNITNADTCNYTGGNCYVLTDRGTFQYLESQSTGIHNLQVVAHDNAASAPGGPNLLVNSFHAYAINPAKFAGDSNVSINVPAALDLLNWLTSPAGQAAVTGYQQTSSGGRSFIGDARPALTATRSTAHVTSGKKETISGSLTNLVPGTPPLAGVAMTVKSGGKAVATGTTGSNGHYAISFTPTSTATYTVSSAAISQIEIPAPTLEPPYGDLLQPTSVSAGKVAVTGTATITSLHAHHGAVTIKGALSPTVAGSGATLRVLARRASASSGAALKHRLTTSLAKGARRFTVTLPLARGATWRVAVKYVHHATIAVGTSAIRKVRVS
jgi:ABC-type tungstate transport system permease subunit